MKKPTFPIVSLSFFLLLTTSISTAQDSMIFESYPWLIEIVDPQNCTDVTVKVYDQGSSTFLFVCEKDGSFMYDADGQGYCASFPNFDCLDFYGYSNPIHIWSCPDRGGMSMPCDEIAGVDFGDCEAIIGHGKLHGECVSISGCSAVVDGVDYSGALFSSVELCISACNKSTEIFGEYPWISSFIDEGSCNPGEKISVYQSGIYYYLMIEHDGTQVLYNSNGDKYCTNAPGYDCLDLYFLSELVEVWQ